MYTLRPKIFWTKKENIIILVCLKFSIVFRSVLIPSKIEFCFLTGFCIVLSYHPTAYGTLKLLKFDANFDCDLGKSIL